MNIKKIKLICLIIAGLSVIMAFSTAFNYNQYKYSFNKAMTLLDNGRYNEAIDAFKKLSNTYTGKRHSEELKKDINKAETLKHNKALYEDALRFLSESKYLEAIESLKKISEDDEDIYAEAKQKITECKYLYAIWNIETAKHEAKNYHYSEAIDYLGRVLAMDAGNNEAAALLEEYKKIWETASDMGKKYGFHAIVEDDGVTIARCLIGSADIAIPEKIDGKNVKVIGSEAFMGFTEMRSVLLPQSVTSIETGAFNFCQSLQSITIPKNVQKIESGIFLRCSSLMHIYVDPANQYFSEIDGVLFNKDKSLMVYYPEGKTKESYTIPSSVRRLESTAFGFRNMNLKTIIIPSTVTDFPGNNIFSVPEEITLKVKAGSAAENYAKTYSLRYELY